MQWARSLLGVFRNGRCHHQVRSRAMPLLQGHRGLRPVLGRGNAAADRRGDTRRSIRLPRDV